MKANIFIVEYESITARDLQFTLEDLGYGISGIANSGESAIQKVVEHQPNLILMDIMIIGEMDGITTAGIISQRFDVPIIFLTAHSDEKTVTRAIETSPYGYIVKPFKKKELRSTIEIALYKHQQEQQLKKNVHWLETVITSMGDGVITLDSNGNITFLNPAAETITSLSFQQVLGKRAAEVFALTDANTCTALESPLDKVVESKNTFHLPKDVLLIKEDGTEIYISGSISPIIYCQNAFCSDNPNRNVSGTVMVFQDVTEKKLAARNLYRKAFYDSLTNLPNRDWFTERLTDAVERVKRNPDYQFAVLYLDLDNFKKVNDCLGHLIGDRLLIAVAQRLSQVFRSCDTIARLGGDEFGIVLESLHGANQSCKVAERVIKSLSAPFIIEGNTILAGCSIGIVIDTAGYQIDDLIRNADIAMYRAKGKGGGCYEVFDREMHRQVVEAFQLEGELRTAIAKNQLVVHYQPIVALPKQEISGFEALVRWNHPDRGLVSPSEFIPIAEETGSIVQIDLWVLKETCKQLKIWQETQLYAPEVSVSINFSSQDFVAPDLVDRIASILNETKIDPYKIKLEITETALIENTKYAAEVLTKLKALGVALSLDDFGKGYSSLSYLQQFPLDVLKIDRCFVRELNHNSKNATITKALIQIAHQLKLTVIAEGVETEAELAFLLENNCDNIQGYYFSPPLAISELEQFEIEKAKI